MRKTIKIFAIITALLTVLAITAFAADFEHCADAMNELGLFKGTQNGYELDRAPTRAEAATMLVRLLGAEEEALELTYTAPYTDVADWAKPYVQYLHDKGLTKGTSATTFGYSDKCTAQQYATFLLRALGYSDSEGGDFTYAEVMNFAKEKGVVDRVNCNEQSFLRDHVAAMSYTALATAPKSGEADLLSKLVAEGAVADAKGYDEMFAIYHDYIEAAYINNDMGKMAADMLINIVMKANGADVMTMKYDMATVAEIDGNDIDKSKLSYDGKLTGTLGAGGDDQMVMEAPIKIYYSDGYMYVETQGEKIKSASSYLETVSQVGSISINDDEDPISAIKSITSETASDGAVTYTLSSYPNLKTVDIEDEESSTETETAGLEYTSDMVGKAVVKDGKLISLSGSSSVRAQEEDSAMDMYVEFTLSNIKSGDGVAVELPADLDTYKEQE